MRLLLILNSLLFFAYSFSAAAEVLGTYVPFVTKNANLCTIEIDDASLERVISNRLNEMKITATKLADDPEDYSYFLGQKILSVASCFSIDPVVFAGLIGHESAFYYKSKSPTGAQGLGQLTTIALAEIAQQLHAPHIKAAYRGREDAKIYWETALNCVSSDLNNGISLTHWWEVPKAERDAYLKTDKVLNLAYSAMIFKIGYSLAISKFKNTKFKTPKAKTDAIIRSILSSYNGASEAEQQSHYAGTRLMMNKILTEVDATANQCYQSKRV